MTRSVDFYHTEASKGNRHISGTCFSKRPSRVFLHQPLWYLLTPFSYSFKFFSYEDLRKHKIGTWWPWTSRWRRYPNGIHLL